VGAEEMNSSKGSESGKEEYPVLSGLFSQEQGGYLKEGFNTWNSRK